MAEFIYQMYQARKAHGEVDFRSQPNTLSK